MGPNAIIQTFAALGESFGSARIQTLTSGTPLARYVATPPTALIDEREFHTLARHLYAQLGPETTAKILGRAGTLTAEYVLANRIPPFVRQVLRRLPTRLALRLLLPAIARFSWTFAGSGAFRFDVGQSPWLSIASPLLQADHSLATVVCPYYRAAFDRMLSTLIGPRIALHETDCLAHHAAACVHQIELRELRG
jgi:divinyl protochlorophyllide a 8-vinyl-reductase